MKFTLIDFGVCSKLPTNGSIPAHKNFRGNLKFCTAEHIENRRPSRIDDLFSLVFIAYDFAKDELPWSKCIEKANKKKVPLGQRSFIQLRYTERKFFESKILEKAGELK